MSFKGKVWIGIVISMMIFWSSVVYAAFALFNA